MRGIVNGGQTGHAGGGQNAARSLRLHHRRGVFHAQHHGLQQHVHGVIIARFVDLLDAAPDAAETGVVEHHIKAAELRHRMADRRFNIRAHGDIRMQIIDRIAQIMA